MIQNFLPDLTAPPSQSQPILRFPPQAGFHLPRELTGHIEVPWINHRHPKALLEPRLLDGKKADLQATSVT